jgi:lipoprotein NlpD
MQEVAELNNIKKTSQIKAGDKIFIPGAEKVLYVPTTVKTGLDKKIKKPRRKIIHKTGMFIWPVKGKVIKSFGIQNGLKHDGINIKSNPGTGVQAAYPGKVVFSSFLEGYGNTIIIEHKNNYATVYANNQVNLVRKGKWVNQGYTIAKVGASDVQSKLFYLHFQVRRWNRPRNPLFYLPKGS